MGLGCLHGDDTSSRARAEARGGKLGREEGSSCGRGGEEGGKEVGEKGGRLSVRCYKEEEVQKDACGSLFQAEEGS